MCAACVAEIVGPLRSFFGEGKPGLFGTAKVNYAGNGYGGLRSGAIEGNLALETLRQSETKFIDHIGRERCDPLHCTDRGAVLKQVSLGDHRLPTAIVE